MVCFIGKLMEGLFKIVEIFIVFVLIIWSCLVFGILLNGFNIVFFILCRVLLLFVLIEWIL